jgi:ABC-type nitrate/sulfonate/bicarbonate transport system permease component
MSVMRLGSKSLGRTGSPVTPLPFLGLLFLFFVAWELLWLLSEGIGFSHSWQVADRIGTLARTGLFWVNLAWTIGLTLSTLTIGALSAVLIGTVLSVNSTLEKSSESMIFFLRGMPGVALIPLLMVTAGSRLGIVLWFGSLVVGFKMMVFVLRGLARVEPLLLDQTRALRLSKTSEVLRLRLPSAVQEIALGVRLSVGRAYSAVLTGGLLAGTPGFGEAIMLARLNSDSDTLLAYIVLAAALGLGFFYGVSELLRRLISWQEIA